MTQISSSKHCICGLESKIGTSHVPTICSSLTALFLSSLAALVLIEVSEEITNHTYGFITHINHFYHSYRIPRDCTLLHFLITKSLFKFLNMASCLVIHRITLFKMYDVNITTYLSNFSLNLAMKFSQENQLYSSQLLFICS